VSEFLSELEHIMKAEELLFDPTPGFGPYKQYFPEDAVQHPAKANTLLIQFLIEKFTEEGDTVLDPMGGTGSTGVIAALLGRNAILVDIEEKFVKWMLGAKEIVDGVQTLTEKGKIVVLRGDARQLSKILNGVDSIVTSPPYSEGIGHDSGDNASEEFKERLEMQRRYTRQMTSKNNIAKLKHGEISTIITSPPYEKSNCVRENSDQFWEKAKEMGKRWGSKPPSGTEEKQYSDNNIGNLPHGSVDVVLTSPPYADAKKGKADEEKMAERWDKAAEDKDWNTWSKTWKTEGRKRALKSLGSGYSESEENIGNLPVGDIDAIVRDKYGKMDDIEHGNEKMSMVWKTSSKKVKEGHKQTQEGMQNSILSGKTVRIQKEEVLQSLMQSGVSKQEIQTQSRALEQGKDKERRSENSRVSKEGKGNKETALQRGQTEAPKILERKEVFRRTQEKNKRGSTEGREPSELERRLEKIHGSRLGTTEEESIGKRRLHMPNLREQGQSVSSSSCSLQNIEEQRAKQSVNSLPKMSRKTNSEGTESSNRHSKVDAVITSPPYSESVNAPNDPERRAERMRKAGLDPKTIVGGKARCGQVDWRYGDSKDNIGNLSHGEISAIITSPPYLKSADAGAGVNKQREGDVKIGCATKGREVSNPEAVDNTKEYGEISEVVDCCLTSPPYEESMSEKRHATPNTGRTEKLYEEKSLGSYPHSENQIGAMKKETYLEAMLKVYTEMFRVLKKSGRAIVIVKPFIREKKCIDLPLHSWLLMQKAGFKLEKVLKLRLKQESFWRILYHRRFPEVPKIKHEYIIIARK